MAPGGMPRWSARHSPAAVGCPTGRLTPVALLVPPLLLLQVERYKQLLLKQRDIMIALTQRLNERDEQILGLQAELEAYDTHQK